MTTKLLYQFDTDTNASVFDSVVAYDGGADHVTGIGNVNPKNVLKKCNDEIRNFNDRDSFIKNQDVHNIKRQYHISDCEKDRNDAVSVDLCVEYPKEAQSHEVLNSDQQEIKLMNSLATEDLLENVRGAISRKLENISNFYKREFEEADAVLTKEMEPAIIFVVAAIVGTIVISL